MKANSNKNPNPLPFAGTKAKRSPFVYKMKGPRNYLLIDFLSGKLFQIDPQAGGDPRELENQLIDNGLAVETPGIIPLQYTLELPYQKEVRIRELQLRITGRCAHDCRGCGTTCSCRRDSDAPDMSEHTLRELSQQLHSIPLEAVVISGGDPLLRMDLLESIREHIKSSEYKVFLKHGKIPAKTLQHLNDMRMTIIQSQTLHGNFAPSETTMSTSAADFFYRRRFNPCWGNKIAVDMDGTIKPCLWASATTGNLAVDNIKHLVFAQKFNPYWELTKDHYEVCKDCEYRYLCTDCPVKTIEESTAPYSRTPGCSYNPVTGNWEE